MSDGSKQDAAGVNVHKNPTSLHTVPSIQFNDSSPPSEEQTTTPARYRPIFRKQFYRQAGDNSEIEIHVSGTPSPLSSFPESTSVSNFRKNQRYSYDQYQSNFTHAPQTGKNLSVGFSPIKCGSAGGSNDELSGESDGETHPVKENHLGSMHHLHPYFNANPRRNPSQFRRHSWIW